MKISVVDLRYRINEILEALARKEDVNLFEQGELKGVIKPVPEQLMNEHSGSAKETIDNR